MNFLDSLNFELSLILSQLQVPLIIEEIIISDPDGNKIVIR